MNIYTNQTEEIITNSVDLFIFLCYTNLHKEIGVSSIKDRTACFTGHRLIPSAERSQIQANLKKALVNCIEQGYQYFGAGGALGFDTLASQTVLELKKIYPKIKLILVLPCLSQAKKWGEDDIAEYERIKKAADKVVYTSQEYTRGCMHKRNRHLVDNSSLCICYLTEASGGTAYTIDYAKSKGLTVVNVAKKNKSTSTGAFHA